MKRRIARGYAGKRRGSWRIKSIIVGLALLVTVVCIDMKMRPVIENMAAYQAKVFALKCINDAMAGELERNDVEYSDLIAVEYKNSGEVSAIESNMLAINHLKTSITKAIVEELQQKENQSIYIPVGTLLGNQMTSGRGPKVEIRVVPTGYVQTSLKQEFHSAGINQTVHQVMLEVNVQMIAIVPGYTVRTDMATNYCIAETVIVGGIPEGYTNINGDDSSVISKVNDYAASVE